MAKNKTQKQKNKKIEYSEEIVTFSDLAYKYQKKLDRLLNLNKSEKEINDLLDEYNDEVEKLFLADYDNHEHKIINLHKKKWDLSPHILDLSAFKEEKKQKIEEEYKRRLEELQKKKQKLKALRTVKLAKNNKAKKENKKTKVHIKNLDNKYSKKIKENEIDFQDFELEEQIVRFSYWKYFWYRNLPYFSFFFKGFALTIVALFALIVFVWQNFLLVDEAVSYANIANLNLVLVEQNIIKQDWPTVEDKLEESARNSLIAQGRLQSINPIFKVFVEISPYVGKKYRQIENSLDLLTNLNIGLALYLKNIENSFVYSEQSNILDSVKYFLDHLYESQLYFIKANDLIDKVSLEYLPWRYQNLFLSLKEYFPRFVKLNNLLIKNKKAVLDALAYKHDRKYLLAFQNNNELRASGGFLGSLAIVDLGKGKIKNIEIPGGGFYDFNGSLKEYLKAPKPLRIITKRWYIQDSNWFADFPQTAQKIEWFLEKSNGPSVDGVVAVNFSVLQDLMKLLSKIVVDYDGKTIIFTADNIWLELQKTVEWNYNKDENKPKKIIALLFKELENKIYNADLDLKIKILKLFLEELKEKNILLYHDNLAVEDILKEFNLAGHVWNVPANEDYFYLVNTNLSAAKTDAVMKQFITRQIYVKNDGHIVVNLKIQRIHTGKKGDLFTDKDDIDYLRIYVPKGSSLLSYDGFNRLNINLENYEDFYKDDKDVLLSEENKENKDNVIDIYNEYNKTVFGAWLITKVGQASEANLSYELPFTVKDLLIENGNNYYKLKSNIQKQAGNDYTIFKENVILDYKYQKVYNSVFNYAYKLDSDRINLYTFK